MTTVAIDVRTACDRCGANLPVNALVVDVWCERCGEPTQLNELLWKKLLQAPALDGPRTLPGQERVDMFDSQRAVVRTFSRKDAACGRCGKPMNLRELPAAAQRGWVACGCGEQLAVRAIPSAFSGMGGVTHLVGEDRAQVEAHGRAPVAAHAPVGVHCPNCQASVSVDAGSERSVRCQYCSGSVVIPEAIWTELHPLPVHRTWYLWRDPAAAAIGASEEAFKWREVYDVAVDAKGRAYFVGIPLRGERQRVAWCCDPVSLEPFWVSAALPFETEDCSLALSQGRVFVCGGQHQLLELSCEDGSTVATLGEREPDGADRPSLDLKDCANFAADTDGSLLLLFGESWGPFRLLRFGPDGKARRPWPPMFRWFASDALDPLYQAPKKEGRKDRDLFKLDDTVAVSQLGSRPVQLHDAKGMQVDAAGMLYLASADALAKIDRDGVVVWCAQLPGKAEVMGRPGIDARGNVYVLRSPSGSRAIWRVSADGRKVERLVDGSSTETPMAHDDLLAVLPDGTMLCFGRTASVRVFAPDGSLRDASYGARMYDSNP